MDSILTSVKEKIGVKEADEFFDNDIMDAINVSLATLFQIGLGENIFIVEDKNDNWSDLTSDNNVLALVKEHVYLNVRLIFDSNILNATVTATIKEKIKEYEWRIYQYLNFSKNA